MDSEKDYMLGFATAMLKMCKPSVVCAYREVMAEARKGTLLPSGAELAEIWQRARQMYREEPEANSGVPVWSASSSTTGALPASMVKDYMLGFASGVLKRYDPDVAYARGRVLMEAHYRAPQLSDAELTEIWESALRICHVDAGAQVTAFDPPTQPGQPVQRIQPGQPVWTVQPVHPVWPVRPGQPVWGPVVGIPPDSATTMPPDALPEPALCPEADTDVGQADRGIVVARKIGEYHEYFGDTLMQTERLYRITDGRLFLVAEDLGSLSYDNVSLIPYTREDALGWALRFCPSALPILLRMLNCLEFDQQNENEEVEQECC